MRINSYKTSAVHQASSFVSVPLGPESRFVTEGSPSRWLSSNPVCVLVSPQEPERQYMHIGTMVEFAFALVAKLDAINKHSFNDFKLRVGELCRDLLSVVEKEWNKE